MRTGLKDERTDLKAEAQALVEPQQGLGPVLGSPHSAGPEDLPSYGPTPEKKHSWIVTIGPGIVRGFASAGVLKSFRHLKWQVDQIIATEMGALVAALYSSTQSVNQFEWALMKVNEDLFMEPQGFLGRLTRGINSEQKLHAYLEKTFQNKTFKDLRIPLKIVVKRKDTHEYLIIDEGRLADALKAALAVPGHLPPVRWTLGKESLMLTSAGGGGSFILEKAREAAHDLILSLEFSAKRNLTNGFLEREDVVFLNPNLDDIQEFDFTKKNESVFRGQETMDRQVSQIQALILGEKKHD